MQTEYDSLPMEMKKEIWKFVPVNNSTLYNINKETRKILSGVDDPSKDHNKLLRMAVVDGDVDVIRYLLDDARVTNKSGTELIDVYKYAATYGYTDIIEKLISMNKHFRGNKADHILENAIINGHNDIVRIILENNTYYDPGNESWGPGTVLGYAIKYNNIAVVDMLIARGAVAITSYDFKYAIINGYTSIVAKMLPQINYYGGIDYIKEAATREHTEVIRVLLSDEYFQPKDEHINIAFDLGDISTILLFVNDGRVNVPSDKLVLLTKYLPDNDWVADELELLISYPNVNALANPDFLSAVIQAGRYNLAIKILNNPNITLKYIDALTLQTEHDWDFVHNNANVKRIKAGM